MQKGPTMLRVETQETDDALICRLEGRLTGEGAEQLRLMVTRCGSDSDLVVDLTEVMFIDAVGENVLSFIKKLGAEFVADTAYSLDICERLQLPLLRNHKHNSPSPDNRNGRGHLPGNDSHWP